MMLARINGRVYILLLTLLALTLRVWWLDNRGFTYDEAFTALVARATPAEIVRFHWTAAFEHTPLWALTMWVWSAWVGQRELALRLFPALLGTLAIPMLWQLLRGMARSYLSLRVLTIFLFAISPILIEYSQKSRMYSTVLLLALVNLYATVLLLRQPTKRHLALFIGSHWLMHGFHYYSALLLLAEAIFFLAIGLTGRLNGRRMTLAVALVVSGLPLLGWVLFSPGFRDTAEVLLGLTAQGGQSVAQFSSRIGSELMTGHTDLAPWERVLLTLLTTVAAFGLVDLMTLRRSRFTSHQSGTIYWSWLLGALLLTPLLFSLVLFRGLATRYILYVAPASYVFLAHGLLRLSRVARPLGVAGLLAACLLAVSGLNYFYVQEEKLQYREMAAYLAAQMEPTDAILLEGPRQHLLTKYYLPAQESVYPVPNVALPDYFPINAPWIVPEEIDQDVRTYMREHGSFWLVLTAQVEVDPGEFVPKYLTAVAYKEDCYDWHGVQLCRFRTPDWVEQNGAPIPVEAIFAGEFALDGAHLSIPAARPSGEQYLLVRLDWQAAAKPSKDYKVTLRLVNENGDVVHQRDDYPIGTLIMPSTWNPGDQRSSFMALEAPLDLPAGVYQIVAGLYDPETLSLIPPTGSAAMTSGDMLTLATLQIDETVTQVR